MDVPYCLYNGWGIRSLTFGTGIGIGIRQCQSPTGQVLGGLTCITGQHPNTCSGPGTAANLTLIQVLVSSLAGWGLSLAYADDNPCTGSPTRSRGCMGRPKDAPTPGLGITASNTQILGPQCCLYNGWGAGWGFPYGNPCIVIGACR